MAKSLAASRSGYDPKAIAARQKEVAGKPQRIEPISNEALSKEARDLVTNIRASLGLPPTNDIPEYVRTMVKHPELLRCQMDMGTVIFKGAISARERELAVLRIAWLLRAPYEWGEHVDISQRYGVTKEEIERVIVGSTAPGWSAHEAAILSGVEQLLAKQTITDKTWAQLKKSWNEQQLLEFPMMVGQYTATAMVQNTLRMRLEADNPGLSHR